jgi:hypothetical protein
MRARRRFRKLADGLIHVLLLVTVDDHGSAFFCQRFGDRKAYALTRAAYESGLIF